MLSHMSGFHSFLRLNNFICHLLMDIGSSSTHLPVHIGHFHSVAVGIVLLWTFL